MKMNKQNLIIVLAAEAVLILCLCLGLGGVFLYNGGFSGSFAVQPVDVAATENLLATPIAVITATDVPVIPPTAGPSGTVLEQLPDGATKFTDYDGGYEISLPSGWLGVRPNNSDEFNAVLAGAGAKNEMLRDQMNMDMSGYQPEFDRLYSYPLRPDIAPEVVFGFSKLSWNSSDKTPVDNDTLRELLRDIEASDELPGLRLISSIITENRNGVMTIVIKTAFSLDDGQGGSNPFMATILYFKPNSTATVRMTFTVVQDYDKQISPDIEAIVASIKVFGQ
jgi:hypothetical protein